MQYSGILLIDKPVGWTSFDVVAKVRSTLKKSAANPSSSKIKIGHTGTLDPFATGLLILVVGDYCKRASEFSKLDKTYETTLVIGKTSTTGDTEGDISEASGRRPSQEELEDAIKQFQGEITQTPPIYSAIKVGGQRAYKLAREGKTVEMPKRTVNVYKLELTKYEYPNAEITCDVSSGTYIRTLNEDIGKFLGVGAYTVALRRTKVGKYNIADAQNMDNLKDLKLIKP